MWSKDCVMLGWSTTTTSRPEWRSGNGWEDWGRSLVGEADSPEFWLIRITHYFYGVDYWRGKPGAANQPLVGNQTKNPKYQETTPPPTPGFCGRKCVSWYQETKINRRRLPATATGENPNEEQSENSTSRLPFFSFSVSLFFCLLFFRPRKKCFLDC